MGSFVFPSGTVTLFRQTAAPTGWLKVTTVNDAALRVVSGTGGVTSGTVNFSTVHGTEAWSISAGFSAPYPGSTDGAPAALTGTGGHTHTSMFRFPVPRVPVIFQYPFPGPVGTTNPTFSPTSIGPAGGGLAHSHPFSVTVGGTASLPNWTLRYVDVILALKQ